MSRRARAARALAVAFVLFLAPASLLPRSLFLGWRFSDATTSSASGTGDAATAPRPVVAALRYDPYLALADEHLRKGQLPVWNRFNGFGEPLLGHAAVGAFNPLDPLRFLLDSEVSRAWRVVLCLMVAGWCTYRLLVGLGVTRAAALVGALAYELNGFLLVWIHFPHLRVAVLLPLVVWAADRLLRRPDAVRAAGLALAVALVFLADHPETAKLVLAVALVHVLLRTALCTRTLGGWKRIGRAALWMLIGAGLGTAAGWIQIGLTVADGSWPARGVAEKLPARDLLGFLVPPTPWGASAETLAPRTGAAYFGVLPLLAALVALIGGAWRDARVRVFGALGTLALLAVAASPAPVVERLAELPGLGGIHPSHSVLAVALAGALLAGLGVDRCRPSADGTRITIVPLVLASVVLCLGLGAVAAVFVARHPDRAVSELWKAGPLPGLVLGLTVTAVLAAAGLVLLLRLRTASRPRSIVVGLLVLTLADLWLHGRHCPQEIRSGAERLPREAVEDLPSAARGAGVDLVLPPATLLSLRTRDVRGMHSGDLPHMQTLLDRLLPSDPGSGLTRAGPGFALPRLGVDTWFSAVPLGPEGIRLEVGGPDPVTREFPLFTDQPVERITIHTSLADAWTVKENTPVARVLVVGADREGVAVTLRAGLETGDAALEQRADFAAHARPAASGSWFETAADGTRVPRSCYAVAVRLDPPFVPEALRIEWPGGTGRLRLHRVDLGNANGFASAARLGSPELRGGLLRYRAPKPGPEVALCSGYRIVENEDAFLAELAAPDGDPLLKPGLRYAPIEWVESPDAPAGETTRTELDRQDPAPGRFLVPLPPRAASRVLVVREAYHPGWRARRADGTPLEVEPVDVAFLGAVLPPGPAETVTFVFRPPVLDTGIVISIAAAALVVALLLVGLIPLRRGEPAEELASRVPEPPASAPADEEAVVSRPEEASPEFQEEDETPHA